MTNQSLLSFQDGNEPNQQQQRHEPMVAMICPEKQGDKLSRLFHNQFMNSEGKWTSDFDHKATCKQDKVEILEYCKKVSPFCWIGIMTKFMLTEKTHEPDWPNCWPNTFSNFKLNLTKPNNVWVLVKMHLCEEKLRSR